MRREVQWSRAALDDLKAQIAYIATDNPAATRRVADKIQITGAALGETPTGRAGRVGGTYEKVVTGQPYIIAYAITAHMGREAVSILRVIHAARDWRTGAWPK